MLRKDGTWTFYFLQHLYDRKGDEWSFTSVGAFWEDLPREHHDEARRLSEPFQATGKCWQQIGIHGSYDPKDALMLAAFMAKHHKKHQFRVAEANVVQSRTPYVVFS